MGLDVPNVRLVVHWQHPSSAEDYLQEFGRAGRDGRPSVAVLLREPQKGNEDVSLLRYMAKKSVENLSSSDQEAAIDHRNRQIDAMSQLALHQGCFRHALLGYFSAASGPPRRSLAIWLLELVFAKRRRTAKSKVCCDFCAQRQVAARGKIEFVQSVLGLG
jgi:ATP-dependent DNA helicase RecQ